MKAPVAPPQPPGTVWCAGCGAWVFGKAGERCAACGFFLLVDYRGDKR